MQNHECNKFIYFHSIDEKVCIDCNKKYPWTLEPGQKSTLIDGKYEPPKEVEVPCPQCNKINEGWLANKVANSFCTDCQTFYVSGEIE